MIKKRSERVSEILKSFTKFGFDFLINEKLKNKPPNESPSDLREMFEDLGASFIKLGQILSTRTNILPKIYIEELSKLQDKTPSFDFDKAKAILKKELKEDIDKIFLYIDPTPIASASVSQVHKAVLFNNDKVVVKIQRPDIKEALIQDIEILTDILKKAPSKYMDILLDPIEALSEIKSITYEELDFYSETKSMIRFKEENKDFLSVGVPRVYLDYSTTKIITQERIDGIKVSNKKSLEKNGYVLEDIGEKLISSYLYQIFNKGFFHGDPHPGNLIISKNKIYFIDFGIMGSLSLKNQEYLNEILKTLITNDIDKLVSLILEIGISKGKIDSTNLYNDVEKLLNSYLNSSISDIKIADLFSDVIKAANKNNIRMPKEFTLLLKSLLILEGIIANLSPKLSILDMAKIYFKENNKGIDMDKLAVNSYSLLKSSFSIPVTFDKILKSILAGRAKLNLEIIDFNDKWIDLNKMINRIVFAVVVGSMIIASALIVLSGKGPTFNGLSILGIGGFLISAMFSLWLLISIIKSGNL